MPVRELTDEEKPLKLEPTHYVVSLAGFVPGVRYDGKLWTKAVIEESALERGPFEAIDEQSLTAYTNPEEPTAQKFTTTKALKASGWYRVTFKDESGNEQTSGAVYSPVQGQLSPGGTPSTLSARNAVRHQIRDGLPVGDAIPVPFNMVRLEPLSDEVPIVSEPAVPEQTVFQVRYDLVPTQEHMTVTAIPGTLVAFVDDSWEETAPTVDVDQNGNFTLPSAPQKSLLVTYAYQYLSDGEIDNFVEESRRWLREFTEVSEVPDGLSGALTRYASALALRALERSATIADQRAGDTSINFSDLAKAYATQSKELEKRAEADREAYYSRGPEVLEPFAEAEPLHISGYEPLR